MLPFYKAQCMKYLFRHALTYCQDTVKVEWTLSYLTGPLNFFCLSFPMFQIIAGCLVQNIGATNVLLKQTVQPFKV